MTEGAVPANPDNAGLWEDFVDVLYQPSDVFERRRNGKFGLALLILVVITALLYFGLRNGLAPITDVEISKQAAAMAEKNPSMTADQISAAKGTMEKFAMVGPIFFIPIVVFITGFLLWLGGRIFGARVILPAAMMIVTYSSVPRIFEMVLNALQGLFLPPEAITSRYSVSLGLARFLPADTNPVLLTLASGLDLFNIWSLALMVIGLSVIARVPRARAALVVIAVWSVGLVPAIFSAINQA